MLVLIRHGRTAWNAERRVAGRTDVDLDEVGRDQARVAGCALRAVDRLVSSPLRRAVETAELLGTGVVPVVDPAFIELDYGDAEGLVLAGADEATWRSMRRDPARAWPNGESMLDLHRRVLPACEALFAADGEGARRDDADVVVVSHVGPIKAAVAWALDCGPEVDLHLRLDNATLTRIGWGPFGPVLVSYNERPVPRSRDVSEASTR